jgi:DNA modification methylase
MGTMIRILVGHVLDRLRELPAESVHCCVTSPPYYGLMSKIVAKWNGGRRNKGNPMELDYRTFTDMDNTQVRAVAYAKGKAAQEMYAMFKRLKGDEPIEGDVIAGCKIDRIAP